MIIREIDYNDFDKFLKLLSQLNNQLDLNEDNFKHYLLSIKRDGNKFIMIIEDTINNNIEMVGTCTIIIEKKIIHNYGLVAHIEDFVINKNYRGKKYGSILLKEMIKIANNLNCYKIILNCKEEIKNFYIKNGFEFKQLQGSIYFN